MLSELWHCVTLDWELFIYSFCTLSHKTFEGRHLLYVEFPHLIGLNYLLVQLIVLYQLRGHSLPFDQKYIDLVYCGCYTICNTKCHHKTSHPAHRNCQGVTLNFHCTTQESYILVLYRAFQEKQTYILHCKIQKQPAQGFNLQEVHKDPFCTDILIHSHSIPFQLPLPCYDIILMGDILRSWCIPHAESLVINEVKVTSIAAVARSTDICIIGIHDAMFFLT